MPAPFFRETPTLRSAIGFQCKVLALRLKRNTENAFNLQLRSHAVDATGFSGIIAESRTPLYSRRDEHEHLLELGKVQNLRVAIRELDGVSISAGSTFSFWKHVGRPTRRKGYVEGRELREGCMIPSVGGGICQLSNALYDTALRAGFEIVERHAHSQVIPGSLAEIGRDATVFWNHIDLRFRANHAFKIEVRLSRTELIVRFKAPSASRAERASTAPSFSGITPRIQECASCGNGTCFRNKPITPVRKWSTALLLNENWAEYAHYCSTPHNNAYGISVSAGRRLILSLSLRMSNSGAGRQRALLKYNADVAADLARQLSPAVEHVLVTQDLLAYLWRSGHLGGRSFDVLMTRLPFRKLHERLDFAKHLHPESSTLREYRADSALIDDEEMALREARKIITPHEEIAELYPEKTERLTWLIPTMRRAPGKSEYVVFPFSTLARKGAYELREVARTLNLKVALVGKELEAENFWRGITVRRFSSDQDWLSRAAVVAAPAFVEHQPRSLLKAIACGIPVIATQACGISGLPGVSTIPAGDCEALSAAILKMIQ